MSVSFAIMAHPRRAAFVEELTATLDAVVVWDQRNDRWDTGRRSMLACDMGADWHVVVQDDAILCRDFTAGVHAALAACDPVQPVSFYTGKVRPASQYVARMVRLARALDRSWLEFPGPWWGVAVAVPVPMIEPMVAWGDEHTSIANYDRRMAAYFETLRVRCRYTLPSLVDHRVGDENPSLVPGRGNAPSRTAFEFAADRSPLDVDWTTPTCHPGTRAPRGVVGRESTRREARTWRHADGRTRRTIIGSTADTRYAAADDWIEVAR